MYIYLYLKMIKVEAEGNVLNNSCFPKIVHEIYDIMFVYKLYIDTKIVND